MVLAIVLYPIVLYLYYVRDDKLEGLNYSNVYQIDWNNCETGKYLGAELNEDESLSSASSRCNTTCGIGTFKVVYLTDKQAKQMSTLLKVYKSGYWCFPEEVSKCNLNTSLLIYTENEKIECVPRYPQLLSQNKIIGCRPDFTIKDYLTNKIYSTIIPSTLQINDIDELLDDGSYRWRCLDNDMANYPKFGSRFTRVESVCKYLTRSARAIGPLYEDNKFSCSCDNYVDNDKNLICTDCTSGYGIVDEAMPQKGSALAYSIGIDCIDPNSDNNILANIVKMPCGINTLRRIYINNSSKAENEKKLEGGCMRCMIDATNTYSAEILEEI